MAHIYRGCQVDTVETRPQTQWHTPKKQQVNNLSLKNHFMWSSNLWGLTPQQLSSLGLSLFVSSWFFNHMYLVVVGEQNMSSRSCPWLLNTKIKNHHTRWLFQPHFSLFTLNTTKLLTWLLPCFLSNWYPRFAMHSLV